MKLRLVPVAITPVTFKDIFHALLTSTNALAKFRHQLSAYFSGKQTYTFTSLMRATYACLLALKSTNSTKNEVIIPRYSCPSFLHGITASGLKIKYCDIDPQTLNIDLTSLKQSITPKTLAIMVTNLFGLSNPIEEIQQICRQHQIILIETADYAHGSIYHRQPVGSFGDYTILNFQEGKALPIGGAAVIERNSQHLNQLDDLTRQQSGLKPFVTLTAFSLFSRPLFYGLLIHLLELFKINRKQLSMEDTIRHTQHESDFKFSTVSLPSISNFQASLGIILLRKMPQHLTVRLKNAQKLTQIFSQNKNFQLIKPLPQLSKIHFIRYPALTSQPEKLCRRLAELGIEASRMYLEHGMNIDRQKFPGAYQVAHQLITFPCHPYLNNQDLSIIQQCT